MLCEPTAGPAIYVLTFLWVGTTQQSQLSVPLAFLFSSEGSTGSGQHSSAGTWVFAPAVRPTLPALRCRSVEVSPLRQWLLGQLLECETNRASLVPKFVPPSKKRDAVGGGVCVANRDLNKRLSCVSLLVMTLDLLSSVRCHSAARRTALTANRWRAGRRGRAGLDRHRGCPVSTHAALPPPPPCACAPPWSPLVF